MTLKILDCFCGMGGVSDGFAKEGFDVTGIDIVDAPKLLGYKHKFIQADFKTLDGGDFQGYDVIWGSPPCRDFSEFCRIYGSTWKNPPDPQGGLLNIVAYWKFVSRAQPKIWIMENVSNLTKYLPVTPDLVTYLTTSVKNGSGKKHAFWGDFPIFLIPKDSSHVITYHKIINGKRCPKQKYKSKIGKWINAKIPITCSQAFAQACREALEVPLLQCISSENRVETLP